MASPETSWNNKVKDQLKINKIIKIIMHVEGISNEMSKY